MSDFSSNESPMQRFEAFVRAILSVSKADILKAQAAEKRKNARKRAAKARTVTLSR
jgi:hypothetical protein